jgi:hypothetical protein
MVDCPFQQCLQAVMWFGQVANIIFVLVFDLFLRDWRDPTAIKSRVGFVVCEHANPRRFLHLIVRHSIILHRLGQADVEGSFVIHRFFFDMRNLYIGAFAVMFRPIAPLGFGATERHHKRIGISYFMLVPFWSSSIESSAEAGHSTVYGKGSVLSP